MSLRVERFNTFVKKELALFTCLLLLIAKQIVTGDDFYCPKETLYWGEEESIPITWPESIASNKQIASDCMYNMKQLLPRICDSRISRWDPTLEYTKTLCLYYQPSYEEYGSCPPGFVASKRTDFCYSQIYYGYGWEKICGTAGGSPLSFLDLNPNEQYNILNELLTSKPQEERKLNVGLPAKNGEFTKQISSDVDYKTEDVELQWLLPGRYGSILKFSNNSAAVVCSGYKDQCIAMCLSINITQSTVAEPFTAVVDDCDNINNVLCVSRKNIVVHNIGCSLSEYYRVRYATIDSMCYSIKVLDQPLNINDDSSSVVHAYCEGNKLFYIANIESHTIYRQIASAKKLGKNERCLFGILWPNTITKYSDWAYWTEAQIDTIKFTNWDKSVDYGEVLTREDSYLTVNSEGKWRWEESATCIVCAMDEELPDSSVELLLEFDPSDSKLTLNVIGQHFLWKDNNSDFGFLCFAYIGNNYKEIQVSSTSSKNLYTVPNVGAGKYWCSGHYIPTISFIQSKRLYAFGMVFAFHVQDFCVNSCEQLDHAGEFENFLSSLIDEDLMKIEDSRYIDISQDKKIMFHVMISLKEEISHGNEHNEVGLSENELYTYYTLKNLRQLRVGDGDAPYAILSVTSREYCLPDTIVQPDVLNWKAAKVGESVVLLANCLQFTRNCSSDGAGGAIWNDYTIQSSCKNQSETSTNLMNLHNHFRSSDQTHDAISNLSVTLNNVTLNDGDVFIVSEVFERIAKFFLSDQVDLTYSDVKNVFEIVNSLMQIPRDVAISSSQLNSTNSLLASFDEILIHQASATSIHPNSFSDSIVLINTTFVAHYILYPAVSGFSGIALFENNATENYNFLNYSVRFLESNNSIDNLLKNENLVLASFVPQKLLKTWKNPKIIFTLFFNDVLFQSPTKHDSASDGSIISLTILNSDSTLSSSIPFIFNPNSSLFQRSTYMSAQFCGYWSFTSDGGWASTGCALNESFLQISDRIVCECSHLTHFGNLINTEVLFSEMHEKILNLITLSGCALSLIGIVGIFVTAIVFRSWRSKSSSKFLLQLSAAIAFQMVLIMFIHIDSKMVATISQNIYGCIATGALLHYSILAVFFWMLIVAYLQFIRYVIVFHQIATANFLLKSSVFGWGMPMLPVFILVAVNPASYIPSSNNIKFCYPSGFGLLFGVFVPIFLIVLANIFVFLAVVVSLIKGSSKSAACKVNDKNEAMWSQLRLSVFLFFVLGLSWIFGLLSDRSILFSYLFCLTATLQGFVLFLYFVLLDPIARNLWRKFFMKMLGYKKY